MRTDGDIDELLREEAEHWRATLPVDLGIDVATLDSGASRAALGGGLLAFVALGLVASTAVLSSFGPPPAGPGSSSAPAPTSGASQESDLGAQVVSVGDSVVTVGTLVVTAPGEASVCRTLLWAGRQPVCLDNASVPLQLVDGKSWDGRYVEVRGVWNGTAIEANTVTESTAPPASPFPTVPCDAPPDGWPGAPLGETAESLDEQLEQEVLRHPELYVGTWSGATDADAPLPREWVRVVGTVGDTAAAAETLSGFYPFNLCVVRVQFSADDLRAVIRDLSARPIPWRLTIDPAAARVVVSTTVLAPEMAEALAPYGDRIVLQALVTPAAAG